MPSTHDFKPAEQSEKEQNSPIPLPIRTVDQSLEEIDRILRQMLLLAELSAGGGMVDRDSLQAALNRLQSRIDRIADTI